MFLKEGIIVLAFIIIGLGAAFKILPHFKKEGKFNYGIPLMLVGVLMLVASQSFVIVKTGYTGVRETFGQVDDKPVSQGFNFKIPFVQTISMVNNKLQDWVVVDEDTTIESTIKGKIPIQISGVTVSYQISSENAAYIYKTVSDTSNLLTYNIVSSAIKATTPSFDTDNVVVRSSVEAEVKKELQSYVNNKYGEDVLAIAQVTIGNISFSDAYNESVNKKNMTEQEAQAQAIENQKNIDKANADAQAKLIKTKADAEAKIVEAEAAKKANEMLEKSLTSGVLTDKWLEKWNGVQPVVMGSDGNIIDISTLMKETEEKQNNN